MKNQFTYPETSNAFEIKNIGEITVIKCNDRLNIYNVSIFSKLINNLISEHTSSILVDMKDLLYIDSSGLGVLFATMNRLKKNNIGFKLIGLTQGIKKLFIRSDIENIFDIYETEEAAMKSLEN